jgi:SAM-dependent methyltransferase
MKEDLYSPLESWYEIFPLYLSFEELIKGRKILEIKCMSGQGCNFLMKLGASEVMGIDDSPIWIELASIRYPSLKFEQMEPINLKLKDKSIDLVFRVHEALPDHDLERLLKEISRIIKKQGVFITRVNSYKKEKFLDISKSFFRYISSFTQRSVFGYIIEEESQKEGQLYMDTTLLNTSELETQRLFFICSNSKPSFSLPTLVYLPSEPVVSSLKKNLSESFQRQRERKKIRNIFNPVYLKTKRELKQKLKEIASLEQTIKNLTSELELAKLEKIGIQAELSGELKKSEERCKELREKLVRLTQRERERAKEVLDTKLREKSIIATQKAAEEKEREYRRELKKERERLKQTQESLSKFQDEIKRIRRQERRSKHELNLQLARLHCELQIKKWIIEENK